MAKTLEQMTAEELDAREAELTESLGTTAVLPTAPSGLDIKEQELIESLQFGGIEVPRDIPVPLLEETPFSTAQRDEDITKFMQFPELAPTDPSDVDFNLLRFREDLKARFGTAKPIGFVEAMRDTRVLEKIPFVGSFYKMDRIADVFVSARNLTLPPEEKVLGFMTYYQSLVPSRGTLPWVQAKDRRVHDIKIVEDWLVDLEERQARGISIGGRIAEGVTELPAFMVEFLLTGPIFKTGSIAAKKAATKLLGRFAEKSASKLAIRVAAAGFGTVLRTAVNVPRILAGAAENMTDNIMITDDGAIAFADVDVSPFKALVRSFVDLYIENLTEISGPALKAGGLKIVKGVGKRFPLLPQFTEALAEKWISKGLAKGVTRTTAEFLKASATKVGYHGILEEMGEEQLGRILRAVTGLEDFDTILPSMEDLLVEAGIFAVPGGVILAQNKIFRTGRPSAPIEQRTDLSALVDLSGLSKEKFAQFIAEPFAPTEEKVERVKLIDQGELGVFEEGLFLAEPKEELAKIVETVRKNEGGRAAEIVKEMQNAGIQTASTHIDETGEITVRTMNLSRENKNILEERDDVAIAKFEGVTGDFVSFPPTPTEAVEVKVIEKTIVDNTAKTKTEGIVANAKEASVEATGTMDAIRRNVLRAEDVLSFWGTAGKKVQTDLREISARTAKNVGNTSQNIKPLFKGLNAAESTIVTQLTDGAIPSTGQPRRLIERARLLKEQLDIMQNEAIAVGLRKGKLTGKAFPQIPNKKGKAFLEEAETHRSSHRVFAWAQNQVNTHKETKGKKGFKTIAGAIAALQNYRKNRLRGIEGYFERKRKVELDLDMREWDPGKVLPGIIEGGWENIEAARQWGVTKDGKFRDIATTIERIRGEIGRDQANQLENYIKAQYGESSASVAAKVWNKRARAMQFIGKLAMSPLTITKNMLDRYAKGLTHGTIGTNIRATIKFPPFLNRWMKASQKIQDEMIRQGAVLGHGHLSEGFASGGAVSRFIGQPFALSERGNQTYIAIVKKIQLEADIKRLNEMGGKDGTVGKMYDRMLTIVGQSQLQTRKRVLTDLTNEQLADALAEKEISDDVMAEVLHRTVTDSAFPLTLASKRMWWGNRPFVQTMTQFKVWSADQMRFIYKDVLKYTVATRDPSRLFRFILGTWLAGELYNIARDFITDKDESLASTLTDQDGRNVKAISKSVGNALVDGGIIGMLADLTYGITDWAFGPTVGSIESIARTAVAVKNDPATTIDGLKQFLLEDIPAAKQAQGVLDRIDRTFFAKNNLTENYAKWRQRSFDFRKKKGELTAIERATGRVVLGRPARLPGPRTLSLELISRQVLVGDTEDAADFIVGIIEDTKPEKLKDLRAAFIQSARNRSPLGNMKRDDIPEFLAQFSEQGQAEITSLQKQWEKNYSDAFDIAIKELKESDFLEDLKKELEKQD